VLLTVSPYLTLVYYTTGMANLKIIQRKLKEFHIQLYAVRDDRKFFFQWPWQNKLALTKLQRLKKFSQFN